MTPTRLNSVKLEAPRLRPELIERPDLTARLDAGSKSRVTLIVAPAGYGKSTTVAQWLSRADAPPAVWLSLDPLDSDPHRFCQYVVAAVRQFAPGSLQRTAAFLTARHLPETEQLADTLSVELEELEQRLILVLDDYQFIKDEQVHELVRQWVTRLPRNLRLIVLTRQDPPWPTGLWHSRSWLEELRGRDLAFMLPETETLVETQSGLTLSREAIALLHRKTEGWAAGLRLALLSLAHAPDPEERVRQFSGSERLIVDYLLDQVLAAQPPEIRSFLAISAPMTRFCASLCDFLLRDQGLAGNSRDYIDRLYRDNLFLSPIGPGRGWYRYHQLFRQLLLDRFAEISPAISFEAIARRAGEWFLDDGQIEDGLRLFVAAGDLDSAADVIARQLREVVEKDLSRRTLARWLSLFPDGAERGRLPLTVASLYLSIPVRDTPSMKRLLGVAEQARRETNCERERFWKTHLEPDLEAIQAFVCFWEGDPAAALAHATAAMEHGYDSGYSYTQGIAYRALGLAFTGREREYDAFVQDGIFDAEISGKPRLGIYLVIKACVEIFRGELSRCRETVLRGLETPKTIPVQPFFDGHFHLLLGLIAYERNLLEEAEISFREAARLHADSAWLFCHDALLGLAHVGLARHDRALADRQTTRARALAAKSGDPPAFRSSAWFAQRLALATGRETALPSEAPTAADFMLFPPSVPSETFAWLSLQRQTAAGSRAALEVIDRASHLASRYGVERRTLRLEVLRALAFDGLGRRREALSTLESAVDRAAPEGSVRPFVDCGDRVRELLGLLASRADSTFLDSLFAAFETTAGEAAATGQVADPSMASWQVLTNREVDVLELLAERLTNKEIAAELGVTAETVKTHTLNIYRKLEVGGRRQAVAVATERGLLRGRVG